MNRLTRGFAIAGALVAMSGAHAQEWAKEQVDDSPRHQEWINLTNGDRTVECFIVYPERSDKAPVVVVIHEIMGMSDWVMLVADQLAEAGFIAIAPDFLTGMGPDGGRSDSFENSGSRRQAVSRLDAEQITADLNAACDYGLKIPSADGTVSVGGFCWGGRQTFRFATNRADLKAAYVFYGSGPTAAGDAARIKCPVYGFYGGNDNRVNATIAGSEAMMKAAGKTYVPVIYAGAGHGFMRSGQQPGAQTANAQGRESGWKRWLGLLRGE